MKDIRCMLGRHKPSGNRYIIAERYHKNGKKYHRNYVVCERCGKLLYKFAKAKTGGRNNGI